ncbi:hypothetical protein [Streptomyces sp. NPDC017941]|uniref:hypothetical protein n=1 Tax=Streptomyces sp. NPDC017941 TaxID=3365018 RepID=UPI0037AC5F96
MLLHVTLFAVVLVVIVAALVLIGGDSDKETPPPGRDPSQEQTAPAVPGPRADVELIGCSVETGTGWPAAELRITNHSSKTSDYWVQVEFVGADGVRFAEGFAATNHLTPGRVASESASALRESPGKITCRITDVTRHAS